MYDGVKEYYVTVRETAKHVHAHEQEQSQRKKMKAPSLQLHKNPKALTKPKSSLSF